MGSVGKLAAVLLGLVALANGQGLHKEHLECPFPEGQDVSSESECAKYSACMWEADEDACHMSNDQLAGYMVQGEPEVTATGYKVSLVKEDPSVTLFGEDVANLIFEVINHEDYHLQIKIYDADSSRYEVPVDLSFPDEIGTDPLYDVGFSEEGKPFHFNVTRKTTGTFVFRSIGPLTFEEHFLQLSTHLPSDYLYGFGENTHRSFKHSFEPRTTFPIFARDQPVGYEEMNEYGTHPYYSVIEDDEGNTHSVLIWNSNALEYSTFMDDVDPSMTIRSIGGIIDLHFFLGPTPEEVNSQYVGMIGRSAFPNYWSLGFHLSRWGYNSTEGLREVRERMKAAGIPQDVQTCDIDYMDKKRDFTYDPVAWADFADLIDDLHADDVKLTLILDPALVIDFDNYAPASRGRDSDVFVKWMSPDLVPEDQEPGANDYVTGYVWPDEKVVFPDFMKPETQTWWANELKEFHKVLPYDSIWIDMNEPANFGTNLDQPWNWPEGMDPWSLKCPDNEWDLPPYPTKMVRVGDNQSKKISDKTICMSSQHQDGHNNTFLHYDVHSLYGYYETLATYIGLQEVFPNKRPTVLSRSTFPGSGSMAIHWLGDNSAEWEQMHMSIIGMLEMNLFGIPMVGADICGFFGEPDMELCLRWMQLGAFYPFSRNHNTIGTAHQDPGMWPEVEENSRHYLLLRYKFLPYLYGLFHYAHMHGSSVVRPLHNIFPSDLTARDIDDQFFWADGIMVAPVITQGATSRDVYFPQGLWYDLENHNLAATGPVTLNVDAPLEVLPLYVRGGVMLAYQEPEVTTTKSRLNPFGMIIALDEDQYASGSLYWDAGDELNHVMDEVYMSHMTFANGSLISQSHHSTDPVAGLYISNLEFLGYPNIPSSVILDGVEQPESEWEYDADLQKLVLFTDIPLEQGDFTVTLA
ncbi:unnamed protein product [Meganyctiphanes norvegica]|uniref:Alpha-glucosidase n=1 Tax=Meganyctiphanes norvegica TaxID=48144 RepID=A0AAV2QK44_MEGNR